MIVFANSLKRIFQSKLQMFFIIILPAVIMVPMIMGITATNDTKHTPKVDLVDLDNTAFSGLIADNLAAKARLQHIAPEDVQKELINSRADYVVVIDRGFTSVIIKGAKVAIKGYYQKGSTRSLPVQKYLESLISAAQKISLAAGGDEKKFYDGLKQYNNAGLKMKYQVVNEIDRYRSYMSLGMFVMLMLFTTVVYTTLILTDKENKTFYRTIAAPVTVKSYMLQTVLSFLMVSFAQVTIIFIVLKYIIGIYMGNSIWEMYLLFLAVSVVCVSLGVAVSSLSKSVLQASFTGLFIAFPMSFLGGCWWPNDMSTTIVKGIGKFTPVYWGMEGVNNLLNEKGLQSVSGDILIMLIFAVVFFFLGTWRKEDIAE